MSADTSELMERELRERAEWRSQNEGPFTKVNLIEWRAADYIRHLLDHIAELEARTAWRPIETAVVAARAENGWISPCLFGKMRTWGWETWVGQCDDGDIWLSRDGNGSCDETDIPSHWMPLPTSPKGGPDHG